MHSSPPPSRVTWPSATLVMLSKYVMSEEVGFTPGDVRAPFDRLELHCLFSFHEFNSAFHESKSSLTLSYSELGLIFVSRNLVTWSSVDI